jgi:hypothetical protein
VAVAFDGSEACCVPNRDGYDHPVRCIIFKKGQDEAKIRGNKRICIRGDKRVSQIGGHRRKGNRSTCTEGRLLAHRCDIPAPGDEVRLGSIGQMAERNYKPIYPLPPPVPHDPFDERPAGNGYQRLWYVRMHAPDPRA